LIEVREGCTPWDTTHSGVLNHVSHVSSRRQLLAVPFDRGSRSCGAHPRATVSMWWTPPPGQLPSHAAGRFQYLARYIQDQIQLPLRSRGRQKANHTRQEPRNLGQDVARAATATTSECSRSRRNAITQAACRTRGKPSIILLKARVALTIPLDDRFDVALIHLGADFPVHDRSAEAIEQAAKEED
jgi:hypothetical protein